MYSIGVDIGGTGIKAGIVSENGQIIHRANCKTDIIIKLIEMKLNQSDLECQVL